MDRGSAAALALAGLLVARGAGATWSIAAVDPATREVGAAAATCTVGIEYIQGIVPDRGVILAQATTNWSARDHGVDLLRQRTPPAGVIEAIANADFDPARPWGSWKDRQYGVVSLDPAPDAASYTGEETGAWRGAREGEGVSVQGNLLRGPDVVARAFAAFRETAPRAADGCRPDLGERLLRALEAGAAAGGDARCPVGRGAHTALLTVARPEDERSAPTLGLVVPRPFGPAEVGWRLIAGWEPPEGSPPPVVELRERYEDWRRGHRDLVGGCD